MKLMEHLLEEAVLTDKITRRTTVTFEDLCKEILNTDDKKVTNQNVRGIAKKLGIELHSIKRYIIAAKKNGFMNKDGSVVDTYEQQISGGSVSASSTPAPKPVAPSKPKPATAPKSVPVSSTPAPKPSATSLSKPKKEEPDADENISKKADSGGTSGKLSKSLDAKAKKFRAPKVTNNNLFSQQIFKMLSLMDGQASKSGVKNSLMMTGDPGTGKTSFTRGFAKLLGIPLITVEAPHITEEHIINIPFMIIKGDQVKKDSAVIEVSGSLDDGQQFEIVQAESNLVTKLKTMKNQKMKEQQHISIIAKDKNLRGVYAKYRSLIDKIRGSYNCILFLDEYYRNDNMKIRNILRNILNGRIGNDKIPKGTFILYASNLDDEGLEDIPMNNDFAEMEFKAPDKEQWFDYVLKKYEENENKEFPNIRLNEKVFNKLYDVLEGADLSYDDDSAEVRTSPRRWEQLLLYINANLPVANVKEARILMSNVEVNFRNYIEGNVSDLYPKVQKMMIDLVKETSGIDFDGTTHPQTEWKDVLEQQIATKIKMDSEYDNTDKEARKYVPIVSGEPGIGKTAYFSQVADNLDLHFIHVDVATLTRESTTGIPKASQAVEDGQAIFDQQGNPVMTTQFSKPELLDLIEKKMQEALEEDSIFPESERKKGKGKYKFLLLFDELSRADAQVFNSIRKLLLEKSFNEEYDLPSEIMVAGALNPEDDGVGELTKHTRDVVDIIPARASWAKTESYLLSSERPDGLEEVLGFDCNGSTVGAIKNLLAHFQSRDEDWRGNEVIKEERMFNLKDGGDVIYLSPREITDIVTMTNANILNRLTEVGIRSNLNVEEHDGVSELSDDDFIAAMMSQSENNEKTKEALDAEKGIFNRTTRYSEEDFNAFIDAILVELREVWAAKLSFTCKKQDVDPSNFLSVTTGFIMKNDLVRDQYDAIKTQKVEGVKTIGEMFDAYWDNPLELYDTPHFDNYLAANFGSPQKFVQEITDFVADRITAIQQSNTSGTVPVVNQDGETVEMPKLASKNFELYEKYLQYMKVILDVLTGKAEYAGKVKEAERTGQYLSNLYASLQATGKDFVMNHNLVQYIIEPKTMDASLIKRLQSLSIEVKDILAKFGLKAK